MMLSSRVNRGGLLARWLACAVLLAVAASARAGVVIAEFRFRGPFGVTDEFIALFNDSDQPVTVTDAFPVSGTARGWALVASDAPATPRCVIAEGTVIPAQGGFLVSNVVGTSLGAAYAPNITFVTEIPDSAGVALFRTADPGQFTAETRVDAVGFKVLGNALFREGAGLSPGAGVTEDAAFSYVRAFENGGVVDTDDNAANFRLVSATGTPLNGIPSALGVSAPRNGAAPRTARPGNNCRLTPLAPDAPPDAAPNLVRDAGPPVRWTVRRVLINTGALPITQLRVRLVQAATGARLVSSEDATVTVNGVPRVARGLTLEEATGGAGGLNATAAVPSVTPSTPLGPGQSVALNVALMAEGDTPPAFDIVPETLPEALPAGNCPPVVLAPAAQTALPNAETRIVGVRVADTDARDGDIEVRLTAANGTLSFLGTVGLTFSAGDGTPNRVLTFRGALAAVNNALDGLLYRGDTGYTGTDQLNVLVNDLGNADGGPPRTTSRPLAVSVIDLPSVVRIAAGLAVPSPQDAAQADVNGDGTVTMNDAALFLRRAARAGEFRPGAYQRSDGVIALHPNGDFADPYFAIKALLAARDTGLDIRAAAYAWVRWLMPRQLPDGRFQRYCRAEDGTWTGCANADADDALMALWLELLYALSPDSGLPLEWRDTAAAAQAQLDSLKQADGVYHIAHDNPVALFIDNVEIYAALRAVARDLRRFGDTAGAQQFETSAEALRVAIVQVFWRADTGRFQVSTQTQPGSAFYPDDVAQTYPWPADMSTPEGDPAAAYARWMQGHGATWLSMEADPYPWGLIALAALRFNDAATVRQWTTAAAPLRHTGRWNVLEEAVFQALQYAAPAS